MASTQKTPYCYATMDADPVDLMKGTGYKALWLLMGLGFVVAFSGFSGSGEPIATQRGIARASAMAFAIFALLSPVAIALQFGMAASLSGATPPLFPA